MTQMIHNVTSPRLIDALRKVYFWPVIRGMLVELQA